VVKRGRWWLVVGGLLGVSVVGWVVHGQVPGGVGPPVSWDPNAYRAPTAPPYAQSYAPPMAPPATPSMPAIAVPAAPSAYPATGLPMVAPPAAGSPLVAPPAAGLPMAGPSAAGPAPVGSAVPPPVEPSVVVPVEEEVEPKPAKKLWEGSFELGLDGSHGNTETVNFRFGVDAKRKTDHDTINLDLDYRKKTDRSQETANRAFLDWRYELLFDESPWTTFVHGTLDYDEFQPFDVRVSADLGLGYTVIDTESTNFAGRLGSGFSHEIGGPDETYVPEAVFGLDFEHKFTDRHKISAEVEYTPDMTGWNDFRLRSRASWESLIDKEMNLSLKLSVLDRYDSTPNGAIRNDVDYSAVLLWKF